MFKDLNGTAFKFIGPSDGPVVVMIHGLGLNQDCWQWTSPTLAQKYRVLTYDLYGHGPNLYHLLATPACHYFRNS